MNYDDAYNLVRDCEDNAILSETETELDFWCSLADAIEAAYDLDMGDDRR